jgi:hypothetical protein
LNSLGSAACPALQNARYFWYDNILNKLKERSAMQVVHDFIAKFILTGALLVIFAMYSHATEIKGVRFAEQVAINGVELELRGVAVLKWAMLFDVYAGGFYLPERISGSAWASEVPKKLELSYFREINGQGFGEASDKLLRQNLEPSAYQTLADRLQTFYAFFRDVSPGDRYSINYTPDLGTELRLNGEAIGRVPGHDFAIAYFGIWLGDNPLNKTFRDRLLGLL